MPAKICDRCKRPDDTTMRSKLKVEGLVGRGRCKCIQLCQTCRDEIVAELNR